MVDQKNDNKKMSPIKAEDHVTISLCTRSGVRLFKGRDKTKTSRAIIGLIGFSKIVRGIEQDIKNDDPYADFYYKKIDNAIEDVEDALNDQHQELKDYIANNTHSRLNIPNSINSNPDVLPIKFASSIAFKVAGLILKSDDIVLDILRANHIGVIDNTEKANMINAAERKVRAIMHIAFDFKHTGVTRDDLVANNQVAERAISAMGRVEQEYLEGTVRSPSAPALPAKRVETLKKLSKEANDKELDSLLDEIADDTKNEKKAAVA